MYAAVCAAIHVSTHAAPLIPLEPEATVEDVNRCTVRREMIEKVCTIYSTLQRLLSPSYFEALLVSVISHTL
jgi:hypothetical protein